MKRGVVNVKTTTTSFLVPACFTKQKHPAKTTSTCCRAHLDAAGLPGMASTGWSAGVK